MKSSLAAIRPLTGGPSHFFGFHDVSPWSQDDTLVLALRTEVQEDGVPHSGQEAVLGVVDEPEGGFRRIASTTAWNWQQGCRAQWVDALGERALVYNARDESGRIVARVQDLSVAREREVALGGVYHVHRDTGLATTVDFARFARVYPGYGYLPSSGPPEVVPDRDQVNVVNLATGVARPLTSLERLFDEGVIARSEGQHLLTHPTFSPGGTRVCAIHRCNRANGGQDAHLLVFDAASGAARVLATDKVSHFDWADEDSLVVWTRANETVRRLKSTTRGPLRWLLSRVSRLVRSRTVRHRFYGEAFRCIDVRSGSTRPFAAGILREDGHPQRNPVLASLWVVDTYVAPDGKQGLFLFDEARSRKTDIARLESRVHPRSPWRCDLHPRWNRAGTKICVDSTHEGRRQVYVVEVEKIVAPLRAELA